MDTRYGAAAGYDEGGNMNCIECPHFAISYEPIKADKGYWDWGRAVCKKHDLVTDFANHGKLKRLECVEVQDERV